VPSADRSRIEDRVRALREAMDAGDTARIRQLTEEVQQASYALSQQAYAQGAPEGPSGSNGGSRQGPPEGVVEGEFREA
jgi:molecular chaperone DnaK